MSDNFLNRIINGKEDLGGELGKEQEAYKEFIRGDWKTGDDENNGKVVYFMPLNINTEDETSGSSIVTKLAADSESTSSYKSDTYFYVSDDDKFALKIDEKTSEDNISLTASIISESGRDISKCVLYCPETNKYFLYNSNNEIVLTGYKSFDYKNFTFNLIYPKARVFFVMPNNSDKYSAISTNMSFTVNKQYVEAENIFIELDNSENIRVIVLRSLKYTDFIALNKHELLIPKIISDSKFELLIY